MRGLGEGCVGLRLVADIDIDTEIGRRLVIDARCFGFNAPSPSPSRRTS